jgi:hypothetical protein
MQGPACGAFALPALAGAACGAAGGESGRLLGLGGTLRAAAAARCTSAGRPAPGAARRAVRSWPRRAACCCSSSSACPRAPQAGQAGEGVPAHVPVVSHPSPFEADGAARNAAWPADAAPRASPHRGARVGARDAPPNANDGRAAALAAARCARRAFCGTATAQASLAVHACCVLLSVALLTRSSEGV